MITSMTLLSFFLSMLFTYLKTPLSMGLLLLIQTILIASISGITSYSFWFSYILFMIFVGGLLVLFIYVSSLASNQKFNMITMKMVTFLSLILLIFFFLDPLMNNFMTLMPTSSVMITTSAIKINLWLYSPMISNLTLFIILYLLLTLIIVVKISNMFKLPLRILN